MEHGASAAHTAALRIGPGQRLDRAAGLLDALARTQPDAPLLCRWFDAAELLLFGDRDRVLLDADHFSPQDIGIVRRFLVARPGARVDILGSDRGSTTTGELLALPGTQWHAWPADLGSLERFLDAPAAAAPAASPALAGPADLAAPVEARAPLVELMAQVRRTVEAHLVLRGAGSLEPGPSEALAGELLRMERCVRGMLLAAERAPRSGEELDLDALVEEELAVLALQRRRAPRLRYQGGEVLPVRVDKAVLVHTLGVLLEIARTLAGSGELVEVHSLRSSSARDAAAAADPGAPEVGAGPRALIRLRAPAGALSPLLPAQLFQPSGLGERLPGFAPSDLNWLARLCASRGLCLQARLVAGAPAQVEFDLDMPLIERPARLLAGSLGG